MSISHEILYSIPFTMVFVSAIVIFRAKTDDVEDAELKIAAMVTVCGASMLLFLAVYAFDLVCKAFS